MVLEANGQTVFLARCCQIFRDLLALQYVTGWRLQLFLN